MRKVIMIIAYRNFQDKEYFDTKEALENGEAETAEINMKDVKTKQQTAKELFIKTLFKNCKEPVNLKSKLNRKISLK